MHLFHGAWSMFQSLGVNNPRWNSVRRGFAVGFAAIIVVINVGLPLATVTGVISADDNPDCVKQGDVVVSCTQYEQPEEATP